MPAAAVHRSPFAGSWYPADRAELLDLLQGLFAESVKRTGGALMRGGAAYVVPHAGLSYSGRVAAAAYRHLARAQPRTVIIVGFTHRGGPRGVWIPDIDAYATPLGEIAVDKSLARALATTGLFGSHEESALCDHSIEIELPLLQYACPDCQVVPVYVAALTDDERGKAAAALARAIGDGAGPSASSDFTHYGDAFRYKPFPHDSRTPERLHALDEGFIEAAGSLHSQHFLETLHSESATICGREPIALMLETLRHLSGDDEIFQRTLDYETSGDITGDYSHSVSYAALGYFPWSAFQLDEDGQLLLLTTARQTLEHYQRTGHAVPIMPDRATPGIERRGGAFVTLRRQGRLRGCVGRIGTSEPLSQVVPEMTMAAALDDARFAPVGPEEGDIEFEISLLSPLKLLPDPALFRVGVDGGHLSAGSRSGLLLPQVAEGRGWTATDFLGALAHKAGVASTVFEDPETRLCIFRAQLFTWPRSPILNS